jgi:hypothetical protein
MVHGTRQNNRKEHMKTIKYNGREYKLPFNVQLPEDPTVQVEIKNRFSGESIMLTPAEAKIHDEIFYYEYLATLEDKKVGVDGHSKLWDKVRKGINCFRQHNAEAYMVLLD